jgi:hypothetical protein
MGDGQKVTGASDCWRDSEIVVHQALYLREVQDEKPDTQNPVPRLQTFFNQPSSPSPSSPSHGTLATAMLL